MNKPPTTPADAGGPRHGAEGPAARIETAADVERPADLYDSVPVGCFSLCRKGSIRRLNLAGAGLLGQARADLLGKHFGAFVHAECRPVFDALLAKAFAGLARTSYELRLLTANPPASFAAHIEASTDAKGQECRLAVIDITRYKRLEERLREAEQFANSTIDAFAAQICVLDEAGKIVAVNQAWKDFHDDNVPAGMGGGPPRPDYFLGANYLEICDRADGSDGKEAGLMAAGIRSVYAGECDTFTLEYPCHSPEQQRWFCARATHFPGDRRYVVVTHEDIAARKRAMEDLQLAALVYQAMNEAIMVTDAANRIIAVNPAFTRLTGYSAEEAIGQPPSLLKSGRQDKAFYRQMWHDLDTTGRWQGEIWNRRKNGEIYIEWLSISTIYDADGAVLRRVATFSDLTEQKRNEAAIWRQANYDALTGLPNRSLFYDRLRRELKTLRREDQSLALLFIDLDHFKEVNDSLGHHYGDQLLVEVARRIGTCVREADTVARLGGDEFTIILPGLTEASRLEGVAQHIIDALARPYPLGGELAQVSASIGITLYPSDAADIETLLVNADQAMYAAKAQGRNRFCYFTAAMQRAAQERQRLCHDLRGAMAAGQFTVYYQPIVSLASGRCVKAEALLRWRHPRQGMVEPVDFIRLAEETGLISEIGDWVFREAACQAKQWRQLRAGCLQISVNKSERQFLECVPKENWVHYLQRIGLPPSCIAVEVTEKLLLGDRPPVAAALAKFYEAGIQVTIDDFGTGHSALSDLKRFHIGCLKIDRSFVRDMATDPDDRAIIEAIIAMAHKLGIPVIAEGVETLAQRKLLAAAGCDYGQGYLFARPMSADELTAQLAQERG